MESQETLRGLGKVSLYGQGKCNICPELENWNEKEISYLVTYAHIVWKAIVIERSICRGGEAGWKLEDFLDKRGGIYHKKVRKRWGILFLQIIGNPG